MKDLKMIECPGCGGQMPELRKTLYNYNFCVNCSTIKPKRGLNVQFGEGDHTFNETVILDD